MSTCTLPTVCLSDLAVAMRVHLEPLWRRLHENDLRFGLAKVLPPRMSQAMCRHTTAFGYRLFRTAGMSGWTPVVGMADLDLLPETPSYARDHSGITAPETRHCWLEHDDGTVLDLTADQFGLAPVLIAPARDVPAYRREGRNAHSSLRQTLLNWEGDPKGTWHDCDLAPIRASYQDLLALTARLEPSRV